MYVSGRSLRLSERLSGSGRGGFPQRSQRISWKGGMQLHRSCFLQLPWSSENGFSQMPPQKSMNQGIDPIPPPWPSRKRHRASAPLREDPPDGDGAIRLGMRLLFGRPLFTAHWAGGPPMAPATAIPVAVFRVHLPGSGVGSFQEVQIENRKRWWSPKFSGCRS